MGATTFHTRAKGVNAREAFAEAVKEARYWHGHEGYSGTIAEKDSFVMIGKASSIEEACDIADRLIDKCDPRIDDKWGPAGCIQVGEDEFIFFGWASE